ncbi:hypothetical protein C8J56DRAFT_1039013 [Mycena floridula]|nr:hypothetical protein C8J56DRAFT_1039013 [Mycena floridula]
MSSPTSPQSSFDSVPKPRTLAEQEQFYSNRISWLVYTDSWFFFHRVPVSSRYTSDLQEIFHAESCVTSAQIFGPQLLAGLLVVLRILSSFYTSVWQGQLDYDHSWVQTNRRLSWTGDGTHENFVYPFLGLNRDAVPDTSFNRAQAWLEWHGQDFDNSVFHTDNH